MRVTQTLSKIGKLYDYGVKQLRSEMCGGVVEGEVEVWFRCGGEVELEVEVLVEVCGVVDV